MALDKFRTLGRSGLHISPIGLGAMSFGAPNDSGADEPMSFAIMDRYREAGGNFIDTANVYCRGESERIVGRWLGQASDGRDCTVLCTKFSASATLGDPNSGGASRKAIIAACEASLRRLNTDYIDLYWMHWQDPVTPVEESMRALDQLVSDGKVRYLGFSDVPAWLTAHAQGVAKHMGWNPLIAIQIEYSLLERTVEYDFMAMATALGLGVTPWSPQAGGALTGKYGRDGSVLGGSVRGKAVGKRLGEREFAIIDRLRAIAERIGHTPGQVALAWVCNRPAVTAPIIGARTLKQFEENMNAPDIVLDAEDMRSLDDVSRPSAFFPHDALKRVWGTSHGGLTLNGRSYATSPGSPRGANSLG